MILNAANFDPTRTTLLRRKMISVLRARFNQLKKEQHYSANSINSSIAAYAGTWFPFAQLAFNTGVRRSFTEARRELIASGNNLDGSLAEFLRLMQAPTTQGSQALAERIHSELSNTASDLATRIKRTLADGKSVGYSQQRIRKLIKQEIDKKFNDVIRIVQTEITRSHADGQLSAFERLDIQRVGVLVEWTNPNRGVSSRGNPSPCRLCKPLLGTTYTLKEARGLIPRHPNCFCSFTIVGVRTLAQIRQKRDIQRAIQRSLKAEGNRTTWSGAKRKIARRR